MKNRLSFAMLMLVIVVGLILLDNSKESVVHEPEQADLLQPNREAIQKTDPSEIPRAVLLHDAAEKAPSESFSQSAMKGAESLPQTEQQSLWTAFGEARRKIRPLTDHQKTLPENEGALYLASSSSQHIRARFLADGVRLLSGYSGREWEGVISLASDDDVLEVRQQGTQIEYVRDGMVEWYHNKPEGLEHGFIISKKTTEYTEDTEGSLMIPVQMAELAVEKFEEGGLQFINAAGEPVLSYSKLRVWDANGTVLPSSMEPTDSGFNIFVADAAAVYPITIDPLITSLEAKLGPEVTGSGAVNDGFGYSVSVDGDTAIIGAIGDDGSDSYSGSAYVFVRSGDRWSEQAKLLASDGARLGAFGNSVSVSGDTALVGAPHDNDLAERSGSVYVFVRNGDHWAEQAKLLASDGARLDWFGHAVSVSGDTILVGAPGDDDIGLSSGSTYVFVRIGNSWSEQGKLVAGGGAVSVDGDTALIGAYGEDGGGAAYVFVRNGNTWSEQDKLVASDGMSGDLFGCSVSLSGNAALIGAFRDSDAGEESGSAYVFVRNGSRWSEQAKLTADDAAADDQFGYSVSVDGDTALVGAYEDDGVGPDSGSAYVFVRSGTNWIEQAKLTAGDGEAEDRFGGSVSVSGDTALIGTDRYVGAIDDSGSAYVFVRSGNSWSEQAKLTAGDGAADDQFGFSVSVDGDTALVGAVRDNDAGPVSGSVYVFTRSGDNWSEQAKLVASDGAAYAKFGCSVSVDGDTALVGAYWDIGNEGAGSYSGSAYVFVRSGNSWSEQVKLIPADGMDSDDFGISVSVSGDTALVGAVGGRGVDYSTGSTYVFVRSGSSWNEQAKLIAGDGETYAGFGRSVSVAGDTALIGAHWDDSPGYRSGSAYVFTRSGTNWSEQAKFIAGDGMEGEEFGWSVSVDGDTALVGAYEDKDFGSFSGSAYVFVRSGTNWSEQAKLLASDGAASDRFGYSVSVDGDTALVGAFRDDGVGYDSGSAYVFVRGGTNWSELAKLTASDGEAEDRFGHSVSLDGNTALVGAHLDDGVDTLGGVMLDQGSVHIFRLHEIGTDSDGDGGSDAFELAYGFNTNDPNDLLTLDSDGDGILNLQEIFHGSETANAASREALMARGDLSGGSSFVARFHRSTAGHGVVADARWSDDLINWHTSGGTWKGMRVEMSESIVASGPGYEIVELTATVAAGDTRTLFLKLDLTPTQ